MRPIAKVRCGVMVAAAVYVLASHYHGDHNGGIGEMIKLGATVVVNDSLRDAYDLSKREGASPQVTFGNFGTIQLGGVTVEMHHFGTGHTRGDTFVYFPDLKVVHTGDVAPEGMPTFDYRDGASALGWVSEMYDLLKLDFEWAIPWRRAIQLGTYGSGSAVTWRHRQLVWHSRRRIRSTRSRVAAFEAGRRSMGACRRRDRRSSPRCPSAPRCGE